MVGKVREFNTRGPKWLADRVMRGALKFKEFAKAGCPVEKGDLRESIGNPMKEGIFDVSPKGLSIKVGTTIFYAGIVEEGIRTAYVIRAKERGVLAWVDKAGNVHFAHKVRHPATKGKFFMKKAAAETRQFLQKLPPGGIA